MHRVVIFFCFLFLPLVVGQCTTQCTSSSCPSSCLECTTVPDNPQCSYGCTWDGNCASGYTTVSYSFCFIGTFSGVCRKNGCGVKYTGCKECNANFYGPNCLPCPGIQYDSTGRAIGSCNGGKCDDKMKGSGRCTCLPDYAGDTCQYSRWGTCNGHGVPNSAGTQCQCDPGFTGQFCNACSPNYYNYPICFHCDPAVECHGKGVCVQNASLTSWKCDCKPEYGGTDCTICAQNYYDYPTCKYCNSNVTCHGHGTCVNGVCQCLSPNFNKDCQDCLSGYYSQLCLPCPGQGTAKGVCAGVGTCSDTVNGDGKCTCQPGYAGPGCTDPYIVSSSLSSGSTLGGYSIILAGSNFGGSSTIVYLAGVSLTVTSRVLEGQIVATIPAGVGQNLEITVFDPTRGLTSNSVLFSYHAPILTGVGSPVPTNGSAISGVYLTLYGSGFGVSAYALQVLVDGVAVSYGPLVNCSDGVLSGVLLAPGQGTHTVQLKVLVSNTLSNTLTFTYAGPTITGLSSPSTATAGGYNLTITGTNFGGTGAAFPLTPSITIDSQACQLLTRDHLQLICTVPAHYGANRTLVVKIGNQTTQSTFSYAPPTITSVAGCTPAPPATVDCPVNGTQTLLTINGSNFGASASCCGTPAVVTINNLVCTGIVITIPHQQLTCYLPQSDGLNVPVKFTKGDYSTTVTLLSYQNPRIDGSVICLDCSPADELNINGGSTIQISGNLFGTNTSAIKVIYASSDLATVLPCNSPSVNGAGTQITCTTVAGVGGGFRFQVEVRGLKSNFGTELFSYPAPVLTPNTLSFLDTPTPTPGILDSDSNVGENVFFRGLHFGTNSSLVTVTYGPLCCPDAYPCYIIPASFTDQYIACTTSPGAGEQLRFTVCVGAGASAQCQQGVDTYTYPPAPVIVSVSGCTDVAPRTTECPTSGLNPLTGQPVRLTITGTAFISSDSRPGTVTVGGNLCSNLEYNEITPENVVYCLLPPGVGAAQEVILTDFTNTSQKYSEPVSYLDYAYPFIDHISGCAQSGNDTVDCDRQGGSILTVYGKEFGPANAKVLVGGQHCEPVVHDSIQPYQKLTCVTPPGVGLLQEVIVIQARGRSSRETIFLSYYQCPAGQYAETGNTTCTDCEAGTYSNLPSQSSCIRCPMGKYSAAQATECKLCDIGDYQILTGQTSCEPCLAGFYSALNGASTCDECAPGYFSDTNRSSVCLPCGAGQYQSRGGQSNCLPCTNGTSSSQEAASNCNPCDPGYVQPDEGASFCSACPQGYYASLGPSTGSLSCIACPAGTAAPGLGSVSCINCLAGYYAPTPGSAYCIACEPGFYSANASSTECLGCPSGTGASDSALTACSQCTPGRYSVGNTSICLSCSEGYAQSGYGATNCTQCAPGYYSDSVGSEICTPCEPGLFSNNSGQITCFACPLGTHSDRGASQSGSTSCVSCEPGKYGNQLRLAECMSCLPGEFQDQNGSTSCLPCPVGTYSQVPNSLTCQECAPGYVAQSQGSYLCTSCPAGKFSEGTFTDGNATISDCVDCDLGFYQDQPAGNSCIPCGSGFYTPNRGSVICAFCDSGRFGNTTGLSVCSFCEPGKISVPTPNSGVTECSDCLPGTYSSEPGMSVCTPCEPGKYGNVSGLSGCIPCEPGTSSDVSNSLTCYPCTAGFEQPLPGQRYCTPCEAGKISLSNGTVNCEPCKPGTSQSGTGQISCDPCHPGHHQPASGSVECEPCSQGYYTSSSGVGSCSPCLAGYFQLWDGATSCNPCPIGSSQINLASTSCDVCAPGKFSATNASTICTSCEVGKSQVNPGNSSCALCPPGRSAETEGQNLCDVCAPGLFANKTGAPKCLECPPGFYQEYPFSQNCTLVPPGYSTSAPGSPNKIQCAKGRVAPIAGLSTCLQCDNADSDNDHLKCICPKGFYANDLIDYTNATQVDCVPCPKGADCTEPGVQASTIGTAPGYWRDHPGSFVFFRCLLPQHCLGGYNSTCGQNRDDVLCSVCKEGYSATTSLGKCSKCPERQDAFGVSFLLILIALCVLLGMYYIVLRNDKELIQSSRDFDLAMMAYRQEPMASLPVFDRESRTGGSVTYKMKILLGFLQITTNLAFVVDIPWPTYYITFIHALKFVNLDFVPWQSVGCVTLFDYYTKLLVITLTPIIILIVIAVVFGVIMKYRESRDLHDENEARVQRRKWRRQFWKLTLFTIFLMYPGVSSTVLSYYVCKNVMGVNYLFVDFTQRCFDAKWYKYLPYDIVMVLVYPIGVPMAFFSFIYYFNSLRRLHEPGVRLQIGFLYDAYHDKLPYWEIADMMHKLWLTSIIAFFPIPAQLPIALTVVMLYMMGILYGQPYIRKGDDALHLLAQLELYLLILAAYILQQSQQAALDPIIDILLSILFIGFTCLLMLTFLWVTFKSLKKIIRTYQAKRAFVKAQQEEDDAQELKGDGEPSEGEAGTTSGGDSHPVEGGERGSSILENFTTDGKENSVLESKGHRRGETNS